MKHSIRQRVLDPVTGLMVTKVETVNGELGSGTFDKNGKEIFEGDIVQSTPWRIHHGIVDFSNGAFWADAYPLHEIKPSDIEVIGHVDD